MGRISYYVTQNVIDISEEISATDYNTKVFLESVFLVSLNLTNIVIILIDYFFVRSSYKCQTSLCAARMLVCCYSDLDNYLPIFILKSTRKLEMTSIFYGLYNFIYSPCSNNYYISTYQVKYII